MSTFYNKYPEFVDADPRHYRPSELGYSVSAEMMQSRHEGFFNKLSLTGKRVLDLGSCLGYTGAWVLDQGASFYQGVEFDTEFVNLSQTNLKKYFQTDLWAIAHTTIEDFLNTNTEKFDVVIASGVIYSFVDPIAFLNDISKLGDIIVIESVHPWNRSSPKYEVSVPIDVTEKFRQSAHWESFIENEPFITLGARRMILGPNAKSIEYIGSHVSIGYLKKYMDLIGFTYDASVYTELKKTIPQVYDCRNRFATRFFRNGSPMKSYGFIQSITESPAGCTIKDWNSLD